ncbi:2-amino-3-carboxymuconate-6-semialdehyde decarboxylase [Pseudozyma hubeiensis]|nr:2-amino-3-carboxymuconate-6-semialdehyde decarboxylase [Pseudozyma hubeiensis]
MSKRILVDCHTHIYTKRLVSLLRSRTVNPRIHTNSPDGSEKLAILPQEVSGGRTVGPQYWDVRNKVSFMNRHSIDVSIVSLANPWLDFLDAPQAVTSAHECNADLEQYCSDASQLFASSQESGAVEAGRRMKAFGIMPLAEGVDPQQIVESLGTIAKSPSLCGAILGSRGLGKGLDDPALEPVWEKAAELGLVLFLHPHYGVGADASQPSGLWGSQDNGHVLPLALGFPFETAAATTRLILAGVFDRHPTLRLLVAHSGGALPILSSRLASCVAHDPHVCNRLQHDPRYYLGKLYYDAVAYGPEELEAVAKIIGRAERYKSGNKGQVEDAVERGVGRMMFGTDHPFFPPTKEDGTVITDDQTETWRSVTENLEAIDEVPSWTKEAKSGVFGLNAVKLFGL